MIAVPLTGLGLSGTVSVKPKFYEHLARPDDNHSFSVGTEKPATDDTKMVYWSTEFGTLVRSRNSAVERLYAVKWGDTQGRSASMPPARAHFCPNTLAPAARIRDHAALRSSTTGRCRLPSTWPGSIPRCGIGAHKFGRHAVSSPAEPPISLPHRRSLVVWSFLGGTGQLEWLRSI